MTLARATSLSLRPPASRSAGDPSDLAEALKESHGLLALAEQPAGIGIWDTDLATDMVRVTPTFFRLTGLPVSADRPIVRGTVFCLQENLAAR